MRGHSPKEGNAAFDDLERQFVVAGDVDGINVWIGVTLQLFKAKTRRAWVFQQVLDFFIHASLQFRRQLSIFARISLAGRNRRYRYATGAYLGYDAMTYLRNSRALSKRLLRLDRLSRANS